MSLNARRVRVLRRLLNSLIFISAGKLGQESRVSGKTIINDVKNINEWLQANGLETIKYQQSLGFYFDQSAKDDVRDKLGELNLDRQYKNSRSERVAWIAVLLLTREDAIFIKDLIGKFTLSRSTIHKDLKLLDAMIMPFRLKLLFVRAQGYFISGDEQNKRRVLVYFLSRIHPHKEPHCLLSESQTGNEWRRSLVASHHAHEIYQIILDSEKYLKVKYPVDIIELLSIQLLLLLNRYKQGKTIHLDPVEKIMVKPTAEFRASSFIGEKIKDRFGINIPDDELCYITVCLMEAKTSHSRVNTTDGVLEILKSVINDMIDQFQKEAEVVFKDRSALERSLFFHIKSAYYRIVHGIECENPLADTIINNYSDLFLLTKNVISHLETVIGERISNEEIALITMHFGGWIEKDSLN